jgi:hypothetical protein
VARLLTKQDYVDHILWIDSICHEAAVDALKWYAKTLPWLGLVSAVKEASKIKLENENGS